MKNVLSIVAFMIGATVGLSAADAAEADRVSIKIKAAGYSEADAIKAIEIFRSACRPLGDAYWSDVTEVRAEIVEETAGYRLAKGWDTSIHLAIRYADAPQAGPDYDEETGVLSGHTLHYDLGGGHSPGFFADKRSSQFLCGLPVNANGDAVFTTVPAMSFLDR